jgi:hypothetical protein
MKQASVGGRRCTGRLFARLPHAGMHAAHAYVRASSDNIRSGARSAKDSRPGSPALPMPLSQKRKSLRHVES